MTVLVASCRWPARLSPDRKERVRVGNLITAGVNHAMVRPLHAVAADTGGETWVKLSDVHDIVLGQKIDFSGTTGLTVTKAEGKPQPLAGTFLVQAIDEEGQRIELMDVVDRKPVASKGVFDGARTEVSTYRLVGPQYFLFFAGLMAFVGVIFVFVAKFYREKTHLRDEQQAQTA